jgi:Domain of unknown function (DUF4145)
MTFDVTAHVFRNQQHGWLNTHEVFSVCRGCKGPSIFLIRMTLNGTNYDGDQSNRFSKSRELMDFKDALNPYFDVVRPIALRDLATTPTPDHLPDDIKAAFEEGAACHSIDCFNAAACMFRLCLDLASRPRLPKGDDAAVAQPNKHERRNLAPRLAWLFEHGLLPAGLKGLASCVKDHGDDGAHAGNITKDDAADLLDFTVAFLERLITEPKKLELAEERRKERRRKK